MNYYKNKEKACVSDCNKAFYCIIISLWKNFLYIAFELIPQKIFTSLNCIKIKIPIVVSETILQFVEIVEKDFKDVSQFVEIIKKINSLIFKIVLRGGYYGYC